MKKHFTGGTVTTSPVESKHCVFKRFLYSNAGLGELFLIFKDLEQTEINKFNDEICRFSKKDNDSFIKASLIKKCVEEYSSYIVDKMKERLLNSIDYEVKKDGRNW